MRDIRSLENIFHEVDIFEINLNEQANLSSTSIKSHIENAVHNTISAIDLLEPKNPEFDFEMEKETMQIKRSSTHILVKSLTFIKNRV